MVPLIPEMGWNPLLRSFHAEKSCRYDNNIRILVKVVSRKSPLANPPLRDFLVFFQIEQEPLEFWRLFQYSTPGGTQPIYRFRGQME